MEAVGWPRETAKKEQRVQLVVEQVDTAVEAIRLMTLRKNENYIEPSQLPAETLKECPQIAMVAGFRKLTS